MGMLDRGANLWSAIFKLQDIGDVGPRAQFAVAIVPKGNNLADTIDSQRCKGGIVVGGVQKHLGASVGQLRPAILEPMRGFIWLRCLNPSWTKRASAGREVRPLLAIRIDDHNVAGERINPGYRLGLMIGRGEVVGHSPSIVRRSHPRMLARWQRACDQSWLGWCEGSGAVTLLVMSTPDLVAGRRGPLAGTVLVELAGIGPGPYAGMLFADMGATVIRIDRSQSVRPGGPGEPPKDSSVRGRHRIGVDLKSPEGREVVMRLVEKADGLFEGFRPGVMERLGIGPDDCWARNQRLVYGRMTGWGQEGPYANAAGHDINYIALAGALEGIGRAGEKPVPPLNLVGDFGGGGMFLAFGMVCALLEARTSGKGQVVDAAMVDGAASLMSMFFSMSAAGAWHPERGSNLLDTGAHFYDVYECRDGKFISIGSIEPQFYAELRRLAGLDGAEWDAQMDRKGWPALKQKIGAVFATKTRDEWCALMEHTDVCFAPVLSIAEAPDHPHNVARKTFDHDNGFVQPAPAPRFSRTPGAIQSPPSNAGDHTDHVLAFAGFDTAEIGSLHSSGAVA